MKYAQTNAITVTIAPEVSMLTALFTLGMLDPSAGECEEREVGLLLGKTVRWLVMVMYSNNSKF